MAFENIKNELGLYRVKKADVYDINLRIEELKEDGDLTRAINYIEKVQKSTVNNFRTTDEAIEEFEKIKKKLLGDISRIDNALTVLEEKERQAITIRYIEIKSIAKVEVAIDRSRKQTNRILYCALKKISRFF